jgi:hypothetical protein
MNSPATEPVKRFGVPDGKSIIHSLLSELKTSRLPSGDSAGHRMSRALTVGPSSI